MTKIKNCLLCKNYKTHPCECVHCEDYDNFRISEDGKALREKIYGDGYQDGHRDGYDKGYDDAQANTNRPQGEWIMDKEHTKNPLLWYRCNLCGVYHSPTNFCPDCGASMRKISKE